MANEYDPMRNSVFRFEHAGIMSEVFPTIEECMTEAKKKVLLYPRAPATIFMSTQILTVEDVTTRYVFPWCPQVEAVPLVSPPNAVDELTAPLVDNNSPEII